MPTTIHQYDTATGKQTRSWRSSAPVRSDQFEVKQAWTAANAGMKFPMIVVHKKDIKLDASRPTFLTGDDGLSVAGTPIFSARAALFVERGGGELGEAWHRAGMLEKKQNVFEDFMAAAEWLNANKYVCPGKLRILGGRQWGLPVGAALTQGGKSPSVPFISGDSDTRVDPLHARKMCALLQASTDSDRPVLLHYAPGPGTRAGSHPASRSMIPPRS